MPAQDAGDDDDGKGPKKTRIGKLIADLERGMPPGLTLARIGAILVCGTTFMYGLMILVEWIEKPRV